MIDTYDLIKNAEITNDEICIYIGDQSVATKLAIKYELRFAFWASVMGKTRTVLKCPHKKLKIPANYALKGIKYMTNNTNNNVLWFADVAITPQLLRITTELIENPGKKGIVRLRDERQVILHDESKFSLLGKPTKAATNWSRPQYWYPADLVEFRRECKQRLNSDGSNTLEFTYRSCDAELGFFDRTPGNWREFTTVYSLYDGGNGDFYQVCQNLGMRELADAPAM